MTQMPKQGDRQPKEKKSYEGSCSVRVKSLGAEDGERAQDDEELRSAYDAKDQANND